MGQPLDQLVHIINGLNFRGLILIGPATNLTGKIIPRPAKVAQANVIDIYRVQSHHHLIHLIKNGSALSIGHIWQCRIPKHSALLKFHDIKHTADYRVIFAEMINLDHWHRGVGQCRQHPIFAVHRMG